MAWADERLDEREKTGVRGTAQALNLPKELRERLDGFIADPRPVEQLALEKLSPRDKAFAYACAAWMARADEEVAESEGTLLNDLAKRLGLGPGRQAELEKLAGDVRGTEQEGRDWSAEIGQLFKDTLPRLEPGSAPADEAVEIEVTLDE